MISTSLKSYQGQIETALERYLPSIQEIPQRLHEAMRYAVLEGGKRIRPLLVYATGEIFAADISALDAAASAVEFIHCYSLVHDDLPAMDNDDLRRGKPTCHRAYDVATAILVGDALQTLAFDTLAKIPVDSTKLASMITTLALASGSLGMTGGQALDLAATGHKLNLEELQRLHAMKTGALIHASIQLGALCGAANPADLERLNAFAKAIGLGFQIQDDIIDIESTTEVLGKRQGADQALEKATYPAIIGMTEAKARVKELYHTALEQLQSYGEKANNLRELAKLIVQRNY